MVSGSAGGGESADRRRGFCRGADPEGNEKRGGPVGPPYSCRGDRTAMADVRSGPVPGVPAQMPA